jgi:hypothetical protein
MIGIVAQGPTPPFQFGAARCLAGITNNGHSDNPSIPEARRLLLFLALIFRTRIRPVV